MQRVADGGEGEERERAESEDGGDGGGGVFFVGVDGALRGHDGGDAADAELPMASRMVSLGGSLKMRPSSVMTESERTSSMKTRTRDMPPRWRTSCKRNFAPTRTMPSLSQSS